MYQTCVMQPVSVNAKKTLWESVAISVKPIISIWTSITRKDAKPVFVTDTVLVVRMLKVSEPRSSHLVLILILTDGVFKINMVSLLIFDIRFCEHNTWS